MKKLALSLASTGVVLLASAPMVAHAADGTITINGAITSQTCQINGNGAGSPDFTVVLPTVSTSTLASAGAKAGRTPFSLALTKCAPASGNVAVYFEPGATVNVATGRLYNATGTGKAANVEVALLNDDYTDIRLGQAAASQNSKPVGIPAGGAVTLNYFAEYHATDAVGAGSVDTSVLYTLNYQ